jgi:hypothetical protein
LPLSPARRNRALGFPASLCGERVGAASFAAVISILRDCLGPASASRRHHLHVGCVNLLRCKLNAAASDGPMGAGSPIVGIGFVMIDRHLEGERAAAAFSACMVSLPDEKGSDGFRIRASRRQGAGGEAHQGAIERHRQKGRAPTQKAFGRSRSDNLPSYGCQGKERKKVPPAKARCILGVNFSYV